MLAEVYVDFGMFPSPFGVHVLKLNVVFLIPPHFRRFKRRTYLRITPRVGATCRLFGRQVLHIISIHAPAWGATNNVVVDIIDFGISIHAPTGRVD